MNRSTRNYLNRIKKRKQVRRKVIPIVFLLCLFVSSGVFWWLRNEGMALESDLVMTDKTIPESLQNESDESLKGDDDDQKLISKSNENDENVGTLVLNEDGNDANVQASETDIDKNDRDVRKNEKNEDLTGGQENDGNVTDYSDDMDLKKPEEDLEEQNLTDETEQNLADEEEQNLTDEDEMIQKEADEDGAGTYEALSPSGIKVLVTVNENTFNEKVTLAVKDLPSNDALNAAWEGADANAADKVVLDAVAVDISFLDSLGNEVEPNEEGKVEVRMILPETKKLTGDELVLYHQLQDGSVEHVNDATVYGGEVAFRAESFSVYVVTALGNRDANHIHEVLKEYEYLCNAPMNADHTYYYNHPEGPYILRVGDPLEIYTDLGDANGYKFWLENESPVGVLKRENGGDFNVYHEEYGGNRVHARYTAAREGSCTIVLHRDNDWIERFYVKVLPETRQEFDHSDIEVTDGGYYRIVKLEAGEDGELIRTIYTYDSFVQDVNSSKVWGENGICLATYLTDDYYRQTGTSTQDELTSKWRKGHTKEDPQNSIIKYDANQVDHVVFDVNLKCTLRDILVEREVNGVIVQSSRTFKDQVPDSDPIKTILRTNVIFQMESQDVVDALNKCPAHNGLDFTVRSSEVVISLKVKKTLRGGTLHENMFEFVLTDESGQEIQRVKNDAQGNIGFDPFSFTRVGTYTYYMKEVPPEDADAYSYEQNAIKIVVEVREDSNGDYVAYYASPSSLGDYEFVNSTIYRLPETGGMGNWWFTLGGGALIAISALLMARKKRKTGG